MELSAAVQEIYNKMNFLYQWVADSYIGVTGNLDFSTDLLLVKPTDVNIINTIWTFLAPLGYGIMLLYFVITILQDMQSKFREIDEKYIFVMFMKLALCEVILYFGSNIVVGILGVSNYFINYFTEHPVGGNDALGISQLAYNDAIVKAVDNTDFLSIIPLIIYAVILQGVCLIPKLMITLHAISRKVELILRSSLLCLSLPDLITEGIRSAGFKSIKKLVVTALHGFIIILVVQITSTLSGEDAMRSIVETGNIRLSDISSILTMVLYNFAAVGLISASKAILNDVFA